MRAKEYIVANEATLKYSDEIRQIIDEMRLVKSNPIAAVRVFLDDNSYEIRPGTRTMGTAFREIEKNRYLCKALRKRYG